MGTKPKATPTRSPPRRSTRRNLGAAASATTDAAPPAAATSTSSTTPKKKRGRSRGATPKKTPSAATSTATSTATATSKIPAPTSRTPTPTSTTPTNSKSGSSKKRRRKSSSVAAASSPAATALASASASAAVSPSKPKSGGDDDNNDDTATTPTIASTYPPTLDARVHRLRHMGCVPGSVSALTPTSTGCGQVVVARTDGSYELKAVATTTSTTNDSSNDSSSSSTTNHYYNDDGKASLPAHRLITIAETPPVTGRNTEAENDEHGLDDDSSLSSSSPPNHLCPDAASSLCWVYPTSSRSPVCVGAGPNGNVWIVDFERARPIGSVCGNGGGIFDLAVCGGGSTTSTSSNHTSSNDNTEQSLPFVAAACQDGSVRIWRVVGSEHEHENENGGCTIRDTPLVTFPSAGAPVLSLVWRRVYATSTTSSATSSTTTSTHRTVVFAAIADGTIRKYGLDIEEQQQQQREKNNSNSGSTNYSVPNPPRAMLRMTVENKGRKDPTKVWTMLLLKDAMHTHTHTLVAGNSLGQVQFWNGETGTLTQTIVQSNASADVLRLVANHDETKIFGSGVDSRVVCLERKSVRSVNSGGASNAASSSSSDLTALVASHLTTHRPWKMTVSQRPHTHDVKAMAIVSSSSSSSKSSETLLTGGVDTKICSYPVSTFAKSQPQTWYPWPSATSLFSSATVTSSSSSSSSSSSKNHNTKLVAMQKHDRVELYELEALRTYSNTTNRKWNGSSGTLSAHESHKVVLAQHRTSMLLGTIRLGEQSSSSSPLRASLLSPNGRFLAISNATSTYVFHVTYNNDEGADAGLEPRKLELPEKVATVSATAFLFVGSALYVGDSSSSGDGRQKVHVVRLRPGQQQNADDNDNDNNGGNGMDVDVDVDVDGEDHGKRNAGKRTYKQTIFLPVSPSTPYSDDIVGNTSQIALPIQSIHANDEFMVTLSHARENGVHVFRRSRKQKSFEHFWTLPGLGAGTDIDARPAAVTLLDGNKLAVATYRSHLYVFDIETKSLSEWSERNCFPIKDRKWTEDSLCGRGYPVRLIPQSNGRLVLASFGTFCVIDLTKPMPRRCRTVPKRPVWKNKKRRKHKAIVHDNDDDEDNDDDDNDDHWLVPRVTKVVEDEYDDDDATKTKSLVKVPHKIHDQELAARSCTICSHYKNILYTNFLGPKEMVVIEQPWVDIAETLPAALQRKIYGAD